MGNCASEPKTKGDDAAAVPAPEPRKEESVQAEEVNAELLQVENKADDGDAQPSNDGGHNKQPSLGALLKEDEEKAAEVLVEPEEAEEKPKPIEKKEDVVAVELEKASEAAPAEVTKEDKKSDTEEKNAEVVKETKPEAEEAKPEEKKETKLEETKETKPDGKETKQAE